MLNVFHISDLHFTSEPAGQLRDSAAAAVRGILVVMATIMVAIELNGSAGGTTVVGQ